MVAAQSPDRVAVLETRLLTVTPQSPRQWGSMSPHEMICHLTDSFRAMLGQRPVSATAWSPLRRRLVRLIALHTPLPWPKGIDTMPEVNPRRQGTRPSTFEDDRAQLLTVMRQFVAPDARYAPHPMFGTLTRQEWLTWTFRHVDHHLRQFGA
jgi:hypothetical protein